MYLLILQGITIRHIGDVQINHVFAFTGAKRWWRLI